ncbi:MAG: hypothetical protein H6728_03340 [Myxococcales bacterium]|nr:hypothetical protein [Myxococcales bacterium]MCB9642084.1 hypothetical protein [Myxococcales bacterium]
MRNIYKKIKIGFGFTLLLGLMLTAIACAAGSPYFGEIPGIGLCETDADCTLQGQTCYRRYCRASGAVTGHRYSLQIIPPSTLSSEDQQKIVRQQFIGIKLDDIYDRPLWMRASYPVSGVVKTADNQMVPAKLRFTDAETINGQPLVWEVYNQENNSTDGAYAIHLTFGVYDVEVLPNDKRLPPFRLEKVSITREHTLDITLPHYDFEDPKKDRYIRIKGSLKNTPSLQKLPEQLDIQELQVDVLAENGQVISGLESVQKDGTFSVRLQTTDTSLRLAAQPAFLRIRQKDSKDANGLPTWVVPEIRIPVGGINQAEDQMIDLGTLSFLYAQKPGVLMGQIRSPQQEGAIPCASCRVQVRGEMSVGTHQGQSVQGFFRFDAVSNSNGIYQIPYLEGRYELEVLPNVTSRWARAVFQSTSILQNNMDIALEAKPDLRGRVCSKSEKGGCESMISGTQVRAVWRSSYTTQGVGGDSSGSSASQYQSQLSGKDGSFELLLDPGLYDLIFIPPTGSELARKVERNVRVERGQLELQTLLPKAQFLIAQIMTPDGFPLEGATIELHAYQENNQELTHLIGRHTTNNLGMFSIPYDPSSSSEEKTP